MRKSFIIFIVVALFLSACESNKKGNVTLKIIHTTDVHGTIFPFDFINNKSTKNSLASTYTYIKEQRNKFAGNLILLDNGDYLQGQPSVYYYNFEDTVQTHLGAKVFNFMRYDAATVGNHDIEAGHAVYDKFRKELNMPYLAANAVDKESGEPYFEPYTIIERQGIKIAVLGLITPKIPSWLPENLWKGIRFEDMVETATKWVKIISEKEKPDMLIGMFHSGTNHLYDNPEGTEYLNENASSLVAKNVPGFDIVLAGHDHKAFNEKLVNTAGDTVILIDAKSHSRCVSDITVDFKYNRKTKKYTKNISAKLTETEGLKPDEEFMQQFNDEYNAVSEYVLEKIGEFTESMDSKDAYFGNSSFIDFVHNVQLSVSGADVSFSSPLNFRSKINKGAVYVYDLFNLYKFENTLYTLSLKGNEIDKYLEYSVSSWFNNMENKDDHLLKLNDDEEGNYMLKGKYYNFSSAAGINYVVDVTKPNGDKVEISRFSNGNAFYRDSVYTVAVNSYRGNGGGGHLTKGAGLSNEDLRKRLLSATDNDIRFLIMNWIKTEKIITPKKGNNWNIIPKDYFECGKDKDMKLLFDKN